MEKNLLIGKLFDLIFNELNFTELKGNVVNTENVLLFETPYNGQHNWILIKMIKSTDYVESVYFEYCVKHKIFKNEKIQIDGLFSHLNSIEPQPILSNMVKVKSLDEQLLDLVYIHNSFDFDFDTSKEKNVKSVDNIIKRINYIYQEIKDFIELNKNELLTETIEAVKLKAYNFDK